MTVQFRILISPRLRRKFAALEQAAATQPGGLRDREFRALKLGLRALAEGREDDLDGKRLGSSPNHHDLRDCAELKVPVIAESRYGRELGPSHRLIYREFESEDGGLPYREALIFAHRGNDLPFELAGALLQREIGQPVLELDGLPNPSFNYRATAQPTGPPRLPLPPDLRRALAAASNPAPAQGAVKDRPQLGRPQIPARHSGPPSREP
ncbi:hypothetical protein ACIA49_34300 [Kribbella sp. NPDC051587]|uniref:hypothetical protein n=1 Tax=Kribbella sp. NPDC051587 TaxID=3364119 RepID=UPI0037A5202B